MYLPRYSFTTLFAGAVLLVAVALNGEETDSTKTKESAEKPVQSDSKTKAKATKRNPELRSFSVEELAKNAKPSVVVISSAGRDGKQVGVGTGFVVSADGLIATNQHVIGEARPISVQLSDGRRLDVTEVHAADRAMDLAILRVKARDLKTLELGDSSQVKDGEPMVVMGNPHGLKYSVVSGVVSGRREIENRSMIQLAMPIEPGNSGGPVLDSHGRVIGVVTMKSAVTNNLGFAVEINLLKPLLEKPNPIPMARWLTIGSIDRKEWTPLFGSRWQQRAGRILVSGTAEGFGGRSLCLSQSEQPAVPFEMAVQVRLSDESGAAGLVFHADGQDKHYGFYPSNGKLRLSCFEGPTVYQWRVLQETPSAHYRAGDWNVLKVKVEKDRLSCYVNDELVIESNDTTYKSGQIGLAKFRETEAEFKNFEAGERLAAKKMDPVQVAAVRKAIDVLPSLETLKSNDLKSIAQNGITGPSLVRARADELEKRASELRRIATDIHVQQVLEQIRKLVEEDADDFDLLTASLLIAKLDEDELDVPSYIREVDRMAAEIKQTLGKEKKVDDRVRLAAINKYLFAENGFHGSRFEYYHRANSYMNRVIDDREGLPITLSVLYMELAKRIDLQILGVGLPGHFIVKHAPENGDEQLIDVFEGGILMSREDAIKKVAENSNQPFRDEFLHHSTDSEILQRMIRNLLGNAQRGDDKEAMLRYVQALLVISPSSTQERAMRAFLRFETGRREEAILDLDWFLENKPDGVDLERIRGAKQYFERGRK